MQLFKTLRLFMLFALLCNLSQAQTWRMGANLFVGLSNPPSLDSFSFIQSNNEKIRIIGESKGSGMEYGVGLHIKYGYKRNHLIIEPTYRIYNQNYLLNVDSIDFWKVEDSVRFGISSTYFSLKALYGYQFKFIGQNMSFLCGANYNLAPFQINSTSYKSSGRNKEDIDVEYNGLHYKTKDLFEEQASIYGLVGLDWDISHSFSVGVIWKQRLTQLTENANRYLYTIHFVYTLPVNRNTKHIYYYETSK